MCYVNKLYYYILHLLHLLLLLLLLLPGPPREFLGPKAKGNLAPPPILQIMMCDKADDIAILGRNTVFIIQFNFPSGGFRGGVRGVPPPPPPKIRKAYVIQR